ncbi:MAG: sporulation protein YunB [Bacillota bacterium]|nr:sporulation protein YunB [Bacillota bacterium]
MRRRRVVRFRRAGSSRRRRVPWALLIPLFFVLFILYSMETRLAPVVLKLAEVRAQGIATKTVSRVINEEILPTITYDSLVRIDKDNSGRVSVMQPNVLEINRILATAITAIQDDIGEIRDIKVQVPLNQILGAELFFNIGPRIPAYVTAVGTVKGTVTEEFQEAGINQTRHVVYIDIVFQMHIVVPFVRSTQEVHTRLPIAQAIIVGAVPNTYVRIGN